MLDATERIPVRFRRTVLSPRTSLLVLAAACNLYLVHAVLVFLLVAPPYSAVETVVVWSTAFAGLALLTFGAAVAWAMLRQLRASEEALRHSEAGLKLFAAEAPAVLWTTDPAMRLRLLRGSRNGAPVPGDPTALAPVGWDGALVHDHFGLPPDAPIVSAHDRALNGETVEFDMAWRDAVWHGRVEPLRTGDGDVTGVVGVAMDVTDRRRAQAELKETKQQLHAMIDASPLAIVACSLDGRVELWNTAAERMLGWSESEVLGARDPSVSGDIQEDHHTVQARLLAGDSITDHETRRLRKDGEEILVSLSAAPFRDAEGRIAGTIAVLADISERKRAEAERQRLEDQFRHAMRMEAVGRLAGGVAHDFNNLITAIRGHVELVLDRGVDGETRVELEQVRHSADRAAELTRQLLAFSRQQRVEQKVVDLNQVVRSTRRMLDRVLGEDVALDTILEPALRPVRADAGQIEQVLLNLAVNARDAMPEGGQLLITTENAAITEAQAAEYAYDVKPGDYVLLMVQDDGVGMDEETRASAFEPFFTTKPPGVGTGLGLSQAYGIVKQHGGYVWADSEPGCGTVFRIYLPRAEEEADIMPEEDAMPGQMPLDGAGTVLVIEDESAVRSLVRRVLERGGYTVLEAPGGAQAVRLVREYGGVIDLVCTDIVMPDMDGREVLNRIRERHPDIRAVFMSGYDEETMTHDGKLEEHTPFLEKPFTPDGLLDVVARAIRYGE